MKTWWNLLVCGGLAILSSSSATVRETESLFSAGSTSSTSSFGGATFSPSVAPPVTASITARSVSLAWSPVTSARQVSYVVTRTGPANTTSQVCTGSGAPSLSQGLVGCIDQSASPGVSYTYTEQPILDIPGSLPWSRPASASSQTVVAPRLSYIGSGPDVSSTGPIVTVPYPSSVQLGDLLLFIAICGTNKAPASPTGWTTLVSKGLSGSSNAYLYLSLIHI